MALDRRMPPGFITVLSTLPQMDMRLGQFFENIRSFAQQEFGVDDLFYVENDKLMDIIEAWLTKNKSTT